MPFAKKSKYYGINPKSKADAMKRMVDRKQDKEIEKIKKDLKTAVQQKILTSVGPTRVSSLVSSTPYQFGLNFLALGTGEVNRIGSKARMDSIAMNMSFQSNSDLGNKGAVRVLIVRQKQNRGNTSVQLDGSHTADTYSLGLFSNYSSVSATYNNTNWMFNNANQQDKLYSIIADKKFYLDVDAHGLSHTLTIRKKLGFVTDYSYDNDGDMEDILYNGLYLIILADSITASVVSFQFDYQIKFTDA